MRSGNRRSCGSSGPYAERPALPISRPAVSRHLRLLKTAGLVADDAQGTKRLYRLDQEGAAVVRSYLEEVWGQALARYRLVAENTLPAGKGGRRR